MGCIKISFALFIIVFAFLYQKQVIQPYYSDSIRGFLPAPIRQFLDKYLIVKTDNSKNQDTTLKKSKSQSGNIMTKETLATYNGEKGSAGLYLAILGQVFDVAKGEKHYGPGNGYHGFAGKDGTRAFISGDFTEKGLIENIDGLSEQDLLGLKDWIKFYHKDYKYVGKLIGEYYDTNGNPTKYKLKTDEMFKNARKWKKSEDKDSTLFPGCNSEWSQSDGGYVWCSDQSGGISRPWDGVPRIYHKPGAKNTRCACIRTSGPSSDNPDNKESNEGDLNNPLFRVYKNCDPLAKRCKLYD